MSATYRRLSATIRSLGRNTSLPIVLLVEHEIDSVEWTCVCHFPNLFIVEGNSTIPEDLLRAGVADATCAIVLSASIQNEGEEAFMVDATTILTYITISQLNPEINLRVELGSSS